MQRLKPAPRWLYSYLNRFTSPDSIIPNQFNPSDYDRYSYVRNNPLKYIDPTGHKGCDANYSGEGECKGVTGEDLEEVLSMAFRWYVKGDWSKHELKILIDTGNDIATKIAVLTNGNGQSWMATYISDVLFVHSPLINYALDAIAPPGWEILGMTPTGLPLIALNQSGMNGWTIAHELAHVFDINAGNGPCAAIYCGGGPADALAQIMGGNPSGIRWKNGTSGISLSNQWSTRVNNGYGNYSTADYFAETFASMIYNESSAPIGALLWMQALISLEAGH